MRLPDALKVLIGPAMILIAACIIIGSWRAHEPFIVLQEGFSSAAPVTTDSSVLAAAGGSAAVDSPVIPPLPSTLPPISGPPAGVMQVPKDLAVPVQIPSTAAAQQFPSLTGSAQTSITSAVTPAPLTANSVPPIPPAMPTDNIPVTVTSGISQVGQVMNKSTGNIVSTMPNFPLDATKPALPPTYQNPGMPAALTQQQNMPTVKPYAEESAAAFDMQRYGQLFEELGIVQRQIADDSIRLQTLSNRIKTQYVPNYPMPIMTINSGF